MTDRAAVPDRVAQLAEAGADTVIVQATEAAPDARYLIDALADVDSGTAHP